MNSNDLLERAKHRRRIAAMAMQKFAIKRELTPQEYKDAIDKVDKLTSIFGAPKDSHGKAVGKAGRTLALMEKWLDCKDKYGLPPVGPHYTHFVTREMDGSHYIWGHDEAARDLSRDIQYNFGFDPEDVVLVEQKEEEKTIPVLQLKRHQPQPKPAEANMTTMAPMVQPLQGPLNMNASTKIKGFTATAQFAYEPAKTEDKTVLPETPVVTRQDYVEDTQKARDASEFKKEPGWSANTRDTAKSDLLNDQTAKDFKRDAPSTTLEEEKQFEDYSKKDGKLYPVRSFVSKPGIKQFAAFHHTYTFTKTPEGWYGPIQKTEDEGWNWKIAIPDTLMPVSVATELEKRAAGANSVIIDQDEMNAFLENANPSKSIRAFVPKKK